MNIALWIAQVLLAVAFLFFGYLRITKSKEEMKEKGGERMNWVDDLGDGQIKAIGILEVLGAIGLLLPALTGVLPVLTAWAAAGLFLTMVVAALFHLRRGDREPLVINFVLGLIGYFVAYGRFALVPLA